MHFQINTQDPLPIYMQIVNQVKFAIARGVLKPHDQLPSIQKLASELLINPNTIVRAYKELEYKSILYTKRGEGCFVKGDLPRFSEEEKGNFLARFIDPLIMESRYLSIPEGNLIEILKKRYDNINISKEEDNE